MPNDPFEKIGENTDRLIEEKYKLRATVQNLLRELGAGNYPIGDDLFEAMRDARRVLEETTYEGEQDREDVSPSLQPDGLGGLEADEPFSTRCPRPSRDRKRDGRFH